MLTWDDTPQKDQKGTVLSVSYKADIPHWGKASIHPHIHHPGVKSISFRMEEEMLDKLGYVAEYEGRSVNSHVLVLIRKRAAGG